MPFIVIQARSERSKMCHRTSSNVRTQICEPREMRLGLWTLRLEGIDPDTPSSRRFSLHRVAVAASRTLCYSRWNEGAKPRLLDKPLHRPSTINAILFIHLWKKRKKKKEKKMINLCRVATRHKISLLYFVVIIITFIGIAYISYD